MPVTLPHPAGLGRIARRLWRAVTGLPPDELLTTVHVVVVLLVVEALIRWVPLSRLSRLLGLRVDLTPPEPDAVPMAVSELPPRAQRQIRCTRRVTAVWPSANGPCLRRSLVAGHLLRAHDPAVRLGVAGVGEELVAHAWIEIRNRPLESVSEYGVFHSSSPGATT